MEPSDLFMHLAAVLDVRDLAAEGAFYEKLGLRVSPERVDQRQEGCARAVMESASGLGRLSSVVGGWSGERCGGRVFGEVLVVGWL